MSGAANQEFALFLDCPRISLPSWRRKWRAYGPATARTAELVGAQPATVQASSPQLKADMEKVAT